MQIVTVNSISHNGKSPSQLTTSIGTLLVWPDHADKFEVGATYELKTYNKPYKGQDQWYVSTKDEIRLIGHDTPQEPSNPPQTPNIGSQPPSIVMECIKIAAGMGLPSELEANTVIVQELYAKLNSVSAPKEPNPEPQEQPQPSSGVVYDLGEEIPF